MKHAKITDGIVEQVQPNKRADFIECPDNVVCGMLFDGVVFTNPIPPTPTADEINAPILAKIKAKEGAAIRSVLELDVNRRGRRTIPQADVDYAEDKLDTLFDEIKVLRGTLI